MNSAAQPPALVEHAWVPRTTCDASCARVGAAAASRLLVVKLRVAFRIMVLLLLLPGFPLLGVPVPGQIQVQRIYCRLVLRCLGVRITVSGSPIRNLRGVLVVSGHMSWLDIFVIGSVLPGSFVARADMFSGLVTGIVARIMKVIPIERCNLRRLPAVVDAVAARLRAGQTVVVFPEGTTWCGLASGRFYPAMFQAAIDAGRPVQPLRLTYHHVDGSLSTAPAFVGDDTLLAVGRPAADRAPHDGARARRIPAAAGDRPARPGRPLPEGGRRGIPQACAAPAEPRAHAGGLS